MLLEGGETRPPLAPIGMRAESVGNRGSDEPSRQTEFITVPEVATLLRVRPQTVRNWIAGGTLPALKVGRRIRIWRKDFEEFLKDARVRP
jgi:excisionase family DNA binding protein